MVLLTPDVSNGKASAALKFSRLILSGVASIMCSASVIMFTCFIAEMVALLRAINYSVETAYFLIVWPSDRNVPFRANEEADDESGTGEG